MIISADDEIKSLIAYLVFHEAIIIELFKTDVQIILNIKK